jgi:hypothetical protein
MNSATTKDILFFLLANCIGFFSTGIAYHLAIGIGVFVPTDALIQSDVLKDHFFGTTPFVWLGCALLSIGYFFYKEKGRGLILLVPAVLPVFYGLSVLIRLSSAAS